jgi:hypothetical protein
MALQLKEGAQVMFIRNDKSEARRFFNGKIATVKKIDAEGIHVTMNEAGDELLLEKETWDNIRYSYNAIDEQIDEEKLGSFSQYPIRLAWAITIHKSQGLTFENAIIDAGESFAPGQVYVALSRCVSLDGMVLHSRIETKTISTHEEVISFGKKETREEELARVLKEEKHVFINSLLLETFDFQNLIDTFETYTQSIRGKKLLNVDDASKISRSILLKAEDHQKVGLKFKNQLEILLKENDYQKLKDRVSKAIEYFVNALSADILNPLDDHIATLKGVPKVKKYLKNVKTLRLEVIKKIAAIQNASFGDLSLNPSATRISLAEEKEVVKKQKQKTVKGDSLKETLALLQSGMPIPQVAQKRSLAVGTIESHVAMLVKSGDVAVSSVIDKTKLNDILAAIDEAGNTGLGGIKARLGDGYTFGEIRIVMNHLEYIGTQA